MHQSPTRDHCSRARPCLNKVVSTPRQCANSIGNELGRGVGNWNRFDTSVFCSQQVAGLYLGITRTRQFPAAEILWIGPVYSLLAAGVPPKSLTVAKRQKLAESLSLMFSMVGEAGIEPTTPGLEGRCSIQLSYSPVIPILALIAGAGKPGRHYRF